MRIAFDAQHLTADAGSRHTGVCRYIERLLAALPTALNPDDALRVYAARDVPAPDPALDWVWQATRVPAGRPALRIPWQQTALPLRARGADVLHSPFNVAPLLSPCPTVVTVHDLAFLRLSETVQPARRRYLSLATRVSARRAARVIAVSNSTKRDIVELLGVAPERVSVIPLAADAAFRPLERPALTGFLAEQGIVRPYVLHLGTLEPQKNVQALLHAFAAIKDDLPHELILVGAEGWMTDRMHETLRELKLWDRVRLTGYADAAALPAWFSAADLFVYPSRHEGFGLPPLEAMACGTPVVVSNVASLPEVVGDAALAVDPDDVEGLAAAMRRVLTEPGLATELRRRGLARAARYSWQRTAAETVAVYREVAEVAG